jgi:hypothetical protein
VKPHHVRCAPTLIVFAATLFAAVLPASPAGTVLTAVVLPQGPYSKVAVHEMGREAAQILKRSGVSLHWRVGAPPESVNGLLVVVKLVGRCDMDGSPAFLEPGPLGWANATNGNILPFSNLACNNLRGAVESASRTGNPLHGNTLLGKAMGRVLAHELYHIVADTSEHTRGGVTQSALTPRDLTSGQLELGPADVEAIQDGLQESAR